MKRSLSLVAALVVGLFIAGAASAGELTWLTSWKDATTALKKEKKKAVMADFTGSDWCGWCMKLKAEVFDTKEFSDWSAKNVVLLEVDFPKKKEQSDDLKKQNKELQGKYGIKGYPTIVFLDADGKELGRQGYKKGGPEVWIKGAEEILSKK